MTTFYTIIVIIFFLLMVLGLVWSVRKEYLESKRKIDGKAELIRIERIKNLKAVIKELEAAEVLARQLKEFGTQPQKEES